MCFLCWYIIIFEYVTVLADPIPDDILQPGDDAVKPIVVEQVTVPPVVVRPVPGKTNKSTDGGNGSERSSFSVVMVTLMMLLAAILY